MTALRLLPPRTMRTDDGAPNVRLLSVLRWLAIGGQLATILFVRFGLGVPLPLPLMLGALGVLVALNLFIAGAAARRRIGDAGLFATLLVDMACLTVQLHLSGGVANPFIGLYLLQVVISTVLLPPWASWTTAALASGLFGALARSPSDLPDAVGARLTPAFVAAEWVSFALAASLLVLFVGQIMRNLASRDARLAALRQRAAEEEHIVRMGLLASGAAHELGTPLASLAVMLGDWRGDPAVRSSPDLLADVQEMTGQIMRCKDILGRILMAAGEVRGEAPARTTLRAFLGDVVADWSAGGTFQIELVDRIHADPPIVADAPLAQALVNLFDNAVEAGATRIRVAADLAGDTVCVTVCDDGTGFTDAMLAEVGRPYHSTKRRHGSGLGLFLVTNVLRTLGGHLTASNGIVTGAELRLYWPLAAIAAEAAS